MSLIEDLKAAHKAATPGPWVGAQRLSMSAGMDGSQARIDSGLIVLLRNNTDSIIAALEEREQVVAILRRWHSAYSSEKYTDAEADAHAEAEAWLESRDALEKRK